MTKEFQKRVDVEYVKYLKSQFRFPLLHKVVVTKEMRETLAYSSIALSVSLSDLGKAFAQLGLDAAKAIKNIKI